MELALIPAADASSSAHMAVNVFAILSPLPLPRGYRARTVPILFRVKA